MGTNCIVSVAFRQPYVMHSKAQEAYIRERSQCNTLYFRDQLPGKDSVLIMGEAIIPAFQKSLYGFKPHAIDRVIYPYDKVIWLDPSVLPTVSVDVLFDVLDTHPMIVRSGENSILDMANDRSINWFGVSKAELLAHNVKTVAGTVYGFNFNHPKTFECFNLWKRAEEEGIFGTQDDFMAGHWADEACMSLAMYKCGIPRYWEEKFTYRNQKEL